MTTANLIMLGIGIVAVALGLAILLRRGGSEASITARRLVGAMIAALGIFLTIFAFSLSGGALEQAR